MKRCCKYICIRIPLNPRLEADLLAILVGKIYPLLVYSGGRYIEFKLKVVPNHKYFQLKLAQQRTTKVSSCFFVLLINVFDTPRTQISNLGNGVVDTIGSIESPTKNQLFFLIIISPSYNEIQMYFFDHSDSFKQMN